MKKYFEIEDKSWKLASITINLEFFGINYENSCNLYLKGSKILWVNQIFSISNSTKPKGLLWRKIRMDNLSEKLTVPSHQTTWNFFLSMKHSNLCQTPHPTTPKSQLFNCLLLNRRLARVNLYVINSWSHPSASFIHSLHISIFAHSSSDVGKEISRWPRKLAGR